MSFFGPETIPDVMAMALCQNLHLNPSSIKRRIAMLESREAVVVGDIKQVPRCLLQWAR